jgi:hypothetical protein
VFAFCFYCFLGGANADLAYLFMLSSNPDCNFSLNIVLFAPLKHDSEGIAKI